MNVLVGTKLCGFTVKKVREVAELNANLVEMVHDKTNAPLCWMDNKEENKLFSVIFKTLPEDSTGVFHILEHSVLCGSEKYPIKEPFVHLMKSSMNTFLNAMTFPDKTMYPVSSRNRQDYLNLISVYLDAVFAPRLLADPNIFYQEGWHAEVLERPCYKGVVYNEMKGAMAGVDERIQQEMLRLLFPDTCYRHNSGGEPEEITSLTYEHFLNSYRRFYHPGNARFYLDGDVPLEETLAMIDEYLSLSKEEFAIPTISMQSPVANESTCYYEVSEDNEGDERAILTMGKILCTWQDREKIMAAQVLCDILTGSNDAPLKRAILSAGLAEDVDCSIADGVAQPYFILQIRNMADVFAQEIKQLIRTTVQELLDTGISKRTLEASINAYAYSLRQKPEPQGLYRAMNVMCSWLYGGDVLQYLKHEDAIAELRQMAATDGFERLLRELLINDDGLCILHMLPSVTLGQEERKQEQARLACFLHDTPPETLEQQNQTLVRWQQRGDAPEQIAKLPTLSLAQVGGVPIQPRTVEKEICGVKVLHHPISTEGIEYLSLYFSLEDFTLEKIADIAVIASLLGRLPTKQHSALELQEEIRLSIGSLNFAADVYTKGDDLSTCFPCLCVHAGYLKENRRRAVELILEILQQTDFNTPKAVREIILQELENFKRGAIMSGQALASTVVQAHYSARGAVQEAISGFTALQRLRLLADEFDRKAENLICQLETVQNAVFCRARLTVSLTATQYADLSALLSGLAEGTAPIDSIIYTTTLPKRVGIQIPAQTAFAVKGYHLAQCDKTYDGSISVLENILSLNHLWNQVRVQGGAYGAGMQTDRRGLLLYYSYRDPAPARSLTVYSNTSKFIEDFDDLLDNYIISCLSAMEPLQTPASRGLVADMRWFAGMDDEQLEKHRQQILATTPEKIRMWKTTLEKMESDGAVCVVGHRNSLMECEKLEIFTV